MSRIFLSYSHANGREARALKAWLSDVEPALANEIFLDSDPVTGIKPGSDWKDTLVLKRDQCEAVVCLLSAAWENSPECRVEYRTAESFGKRIFPVRLEPESPDGSHINGVWQRCDLYGEGPQTPIDIGDGEPPVSFATDGLLRLRDGIRGAGIGAECCVWPPPKDPDRAPYRGRDAFDDDDAGVFFGRDTAIFKGMDILRSMRGDAATAEETDDLAFLRHEGQKLFVIRGSSGAGKSSFLRAGLLYRLRKQDRLFLVLDVVRPGRDVLTGPSGLASSITSVRTKLGLGQLDLGAIKKRINDAASVRELLIECQHAATVGLSDIVESGQLPTVVLPLDQADELFSADAGPEARRFLDLVNKLCAPSQESPLGLIVAATIRTDSYRLLQEAPELVDVPEPAVAELKPLGVDSFKEVIKGPAARSKDSKRPFTIESELVDKLVEDCTKGVCALPVLSLTLSRLANEYTGDGTITLDEYEDGLGGICRVVKGEVDDALANDPSERQAQLDLLREAFIPWLVTMDVNGQPMRRAANWSDLPNAARPLIDKLVEKRLLVKGGSEAQTTVEITLDCLLTDWDDLKGWLEQEAPDLRTIAALEREYGEWDASGRGADHLLPMTRLKAGEQLAANNRYGGRLAKLHEFLAASGIAINQKLEKDLRRTRILLAAVAVLLVAAVVATGVAVNTTKAANRARNDANQARELAEARYREAVSLRLVSEAQAMLAGTRSEGDARAFQELLAARTQTDTPDDGAIFSAAVQRLNTLKIINAPEVLRTVAFSPDGKHIASASLSDKTVRIWDATTGRPVGTPEPAHLDKVFSVAYSPDGRRLVTASADTTVRIWDAATGKPIGEPLRGHTNQVYAAVFSPDGRRVASAGADETIRIWDAESGAPIGVPLTGHTGAVWTLAFSPDGKRLVSGGNDRTIRQWNAETGAPIGAPITGHSDIVWSVAFSPNGQRIVSASGDTTVRQWNTGTGAPIGTPMSGHTNSVASAAYSADGGRIVSGSADDTIRIWDAGTGQPIGVPLEGHNNGVMSVAFSPDGTRIVSGSTDNTVRLWDATNVQPGGRVVGSHTAPALSVVFSPDSSRIASGGMDNLIRLWDPRTSQPAGPPMQGHTAGVFSLAFNVDGSRLISGGADGTVRLWDVRARQQVGPPLRGHEGNVLGVAINAKGDRIVSGGTDGTVRVWDVANGNEIQKIPKAHDGRWVSSVAINAAGDRIVTGGNDGMVRLWDARTGERVGQPLIGPGLRTSHDGAVTSVAFSPDGTRVVSGSIDTTERVWDVDNGTQVSLMTGHQGTVTSLAFSPDGKRIVTGSVDRTVRLWDVASGKPFGQPMRGHGNWVLRVAFSPDGRSVASTSGDTTVRWWPAAVSDGDLCDKLTSNMSHKQWNEWVSDRLPYVQVCQDLPVAPD